MNSNIGVLVIYWDNVSDSEQRKIITNLFKDNQKVISGMSDNEYGGETEDMINKIPVFLEGGYTEKN